MRVICAWCDTIIREDDRPSTVLEDSHGICGPCAERVEAEARISHERTLVYARIVKRHTRDVPACQRFGGL